MRLLVAGDVHGDAAHMIYLFEMALANDARDIMQLGDFSYWEHLTGGVAFLDMCSEVCVENDMRLYWIDGNHENHTLLRQWYGPGGPKHQPTPEGFWQVRPNVFYVPRGTRWNWNGVELMGLGGAYSIDKDYRLGEEARARKKIADLEKVGLELDEHLKQNKAALANGGHTLWWPEEQITLNEVARALRSMEPIDILFTHDKPRGSDPGWGRSEIPAAHPNQDAIQRVIRELQPSLVIHGHLHYRYLDRMTFSTPYGQTAYTDVMGLDCNTSASTDGAPEDSWTVLDLKK